MWSNFGIAVHDKFITCFEVEHKFQNCRFFPIKQKPPPIFLTSSLTHSFWVKYVAQFPAETQSSIYDPSGPFCPVSACWVFRWDFLEASGWLTMCWADGLHQGNKSEGFGTQQISCACSWCSLYPPPGIPWCQGNPCSFAASWFLLMFKGVLWSVPACGIP